jgi:long-chain acyl-CoA synthetase
MAADYSNNHHPLIKDFQIPAIIVGDRDISYSKMLQYISLFGQYTPQTKGSKSIILSENREGWIYAFFSIWLNHGIAIPIDFTSLPQDIAYVVKDCHPDCIWTSSLKAENARAALKIAGIDIPILIIDDYEMVEIPADTRPAEIEYDATDTAVITYTSGTTGSPKGVMLSYNNLLADMDCTARTLPINTSQMRSIIMLPLHHSLPLLGSFLMPMIWGAGVSICPTLLGPDIMATLKRGNIGIMVGVPALWTALIRIVKKKVYSKISGRIMFHICKVIQSRWLSRKVFKQIHETMGEHLFPISGGAALDKQVAIDCKTLGLDMLEGYGMSETSPIMSLTRVDDIHPGSVGKPLPDNKIIIKNGEVCVKGPILMQGYYNRPEETKEMYDDDGWLHTGDMGRFDRKGRLFITGRIKDIIVLSNGKNVNPVEIEEKLAKRSDLVEEIAIIQEGDILRAIIVPNTKWAKNRSLEELKVTLRQELIKSYNKSSLPYKKILAFSVYQGKLPRNRLGKLQRFKIASLIPKEDHDW